MRKTLIGTRRDAIVKGSLAAAGVASAIPIPRALAQRRERAERAEKLQPNDPLAQSVKYVEDAANAPPDLRKPESFCNNCQFFQGEAQSAEAPCMVLMNKLVPAQAWCNTWVMKGAGASPR